MTQREQWMHALNEHLREVEKLSRDMRALGGETALECDPLTRRQIEYAAAQMIRHEISAALISSRLAAGNNASPFALAAARSQR